VLGKVLRTIGSTLVAVSIIYLSLSRIGKQTATSYRELIPRQAAIVLASVFRNKPCLFIYLIFIST
jgi:hypothetical protein